MTYTLWLTIWLHGAQYGDPMHNFTYPTIERCMEVGKIWTEYDNKYLKSGEGGVLETYECKPTEKGW